MLNGSIFITTSKRKKLIVSLNQIHTPTTNCECLVDDAWCVSSKFNKLLRYTNVVMANVIWFTYTLSLSLFPFCVSLCHPFTVCESVSCVSARSALCILGSLCDLNNLKTFHKSLHRMVHTLSTQYLQDNLLPRALNDAILHL